MERRKLLRFMRRVSKLGRYVKSQEQRLRRLMAEQMVTDGELEMLIKEPDGYMLVVDAREQGRHVTLSDADEINKQRAYARAKKHEEKRQRDKKARDDQLAREKAERKQMRLEAKKKQLLEMASMLKGMGINPIDGPLVPTGPS